MANKSTGIYGHFGNFSAVAQLPNTAGATVQTSELSVGDLATTGGALYICTTATLGAAAWLAVGGSAAGGGGFRFVVGNALEGDTLSDCDFLDPGDGTGIEAAFAAATIAGVGEVYIRAGVYDLGAGVATLPLTPPSGITIRGAGNGAVLAGAASVIVAGGTNLLVGDARNVMTLPLTIRMRDLSFEVADLVGAASGPVMVGGAAPGDIVFATLENVGVRLPLATDITDTLAIVFYAGVGRIDWDGGGIDGVYANGAAGGASDIQLINAPESRITNARFAGSDEGVIAPQLHMSLTELACINSARCSEGEIHGCEFTAAGTGGVSLDITSSGNGVRVIGNTFRDSADDNAATIRTDADRTHIVGNMVGGGVIGVHVTAGSSGSILVANTIAGTTPVTDAGTLTIQANNN